ncbi:flagellar hook-length control protein FliK [Methylorubrum populi]|uniref:Flagellar hook-length control protein FliK n=1 Tax=Methylobacterium radiotolerans TaxID=31998 RepID=A0ABU7T8U6_9HYPH
MRSLDTLIPLRSKLEAGRSPVGEEAGAAPGFEAMLGALENGAPQRGEAATGEPEAGADKPAASASETPLAPGTEPGSVLQALMALAGPAAPLFAPAPSAGVEAMVQRAAARSGSRADTISAETTGPVSVVGLETHFAPVRPRGSAPSLSDAPGLGKVAGERSAPAANPAPVGTGAAPEIPAAESGARATSIPRDASDADTAPSESADRSAPVREQQMAGFRSPAGGPSASDTPPEPAGMFGLGRYTRTDEAAGLVSPQPATPRPTMSDAARSSDMRAAAPPLGESPQPGQPGFEQASPTGSAAVEAAPAQAAMPASPQGQAGGGRTIRPAGTTDATALSRSVEPAAADASEPSPLLQPGATGPAERGREPGRLHPSGSDRAAPNSFVGPAAADVSEPSTLSRPGATPPAERGPEPQRAHPAGGARGEPIAAQAAPSVPGTEVEPRRGQAKAGAATDLPGAEALVPEAPSVEPAAHETAAAPVPTPGSPLRQIVDAISAQLPAAPAALARLIPVPGEAGPLKILTLQLHPAELGSVLVRMRLQDGRLEMNLRTSREETAERLRKEGDLLSGLLREAGYEPEAVTIQGGGTGSGESGPRGQGFGAFAESQGGQHDGQPGAATQDHSGRRPSPRADEAAKPREEQEHETDSGGRDRGSLYL